MITETSLLDPEEGIRFRGKTMKQIRSELPHALPAQGSKLVPREPLPEGVFWLLLTGEVPNQDEVTLLTEELHRRAAAIPSHILHLIDSFPQVFLHFIETVRSFISRSPSS